MRVLDLASLEGHYAFEIAKRGARVLGIEGRATNIERALQRKTELGLTNVEFTQDDVRNLSRDKYGEFDVVMCLGILYHLDMPDALEFLESISETCRSFAVIDTHISTTPDSVCTYKGHDYHGWYYTEYPEKPTRETEEQSVWASIGNTKSFWFTRPSLYNALAHVGFNSIYECHVPTTTDIPSDRITLIALKSPVENLIESPLTEEEICEEYDEHFHEVLSPPQAAYREALRATPTQPSLRKGLLSRLLRL